MKNYVLRSILTALLLSPTLAHASTDNGYKLIRICSVFIRLVENPTYAPNAFETSQAGECMGFMRGMRYFFKVQEAQQKSSVCIPDISNLDYVRSIVAYGNKHTELQKEYDTTMLIKAAETLYPCK